MTLASRTLATFALFFFMLADVWSLSVRPHRCISNHHIPSNSKIDSRRFDYPKHARKSWRQRAGLFGWSADPGSTTRNNRKKSEYASHQIFRRLYKWLGQKWYQWKKFWRSITERYTVYVLECEDGKYYVGSTSHRKQRWRQHQRQSGGSVWTRKYKPIRILKEYRRIPRLYVLGMESQVTAQLMLKYGVNNVRGAMFVLARKYTMKDLDALVGFMGHYNELGYASVRKTLTNALPPASTEQPTQQMSASPPTKQVTTGGAFKSQDRDSVRRALFISNPEIEHLPGPRCYRCGQRGHLAASCPEDDVICFKCGQKGHRSFECPIDNWTSTNGFNSEREDST